MSRVAIILSVPPCGSFCEQILEPVFCAPSVSPFGHSKEGYLSQICNLILTMYPFFFLKVPFCGGFLVICLPSPLVVNIKFKMEWLRRTSSLRSRICHVLTCIFLCACYRVAGNVNSS